MSIRKPARTPLPPGTIIEYMGEEATVLEDKGGDSLVVECYGDRQKWRWTFEDVSCSVVSMPDEIEPKAGTSF